MKKSAFTLTELVVAMVVITLVVTVTLPLTKRKMHKVDNFSYYLGYETAKSIAREIIPKIGQEESSDSDCFAEVDGVCLTMAPQAAQSYKWNECDDGITTNADDLAFMSKYGISKCCNLIGCNSYGDYWAGAAQLCGGVNKMASLNDLAKIAGYIYGKSMASNEEVSGVTFDPTKAAELGLPSTPSFYLLSGEGYAGNTMFTRLFETDSTTWDDLSRFKDSDALAVCVVGSAEDNFSGSLLNNLESAFNNSQSATTTTTPVTSVQTAATSRDFSSLTPHLTLTNGLRIYIGSDYAEIAELSDSVNENDRIGFIIYIDVNGKSGKSMLYEDIFPFYLVKSGKVIPGYNPAIASGPVSRDYMGVNVIFDSYTDGTRSVKLLLKDANFKKAACVAGYVTSATYCDGEV